MIHHDFTTIEKNIDSCFHLKNKSPPVFITLMHWQSSHGSFHWYPQPDGSGRCNCRLIIVRTLEAIHPAPKSESHTWFWCAQFLFYFFEWYPQIVSILISSWSSYHLSHQGNNAPYRTKLLKEYDHEIHQNFRCSCRSIHDVFRCLCSERQRYRLHPGSCWSKNCRTGRWTRCVIQNHQRSVQ